MILDSAQNIISHFLIQCAVNGNENVDDDDVEVDVDNDDGGGVSL